MLSTDRDSTHRADPLTRLRHMAGGLDLIAAGAVLLTYIGLEWLSFIHEHKGVPVTPWNPGLGVVFAWLVMKGAAYGLVLFVGVIIAEIFVLKTELSWPVILAMAVVISVSYTVVASITRRYLRLDAGLHHVGDVLVLLAAGAIGALVSTVLLSLLLLATNELRIADLPQSSLPLLVGDAIGIAVVTPLVLRLSLRWTDITWQGLRQLVPEILLYTLVTGFALWMIMGSVAPNDYKFLSLLFLPVVAAAVRHGIDGSCLALAAAQLALVVLLHRYGYDARTFTEFQVVMLILTMTGLLVGVVVSEREQASLAARRAEMRLKDMQLEAARASRMNLISGMASALAHEINQPMTAARAFARSVQEILKAPNSDRARVDTNLTNLIANIDHAAGVIRRMREFLRRGQPHLSTLDVASTLDDALVLVRPEAAKSHIRIDLDVGEKIPDIFADRIQLQQVVLNLVRNAIEAIVETRRTDGHIQVSARLAQDGSAVEIAVIDNGIGVPEDRTLFEPLSSSKAEGLGLGLSISASIIQAHGGRIWLHSRESGATELRFTLPVQSKDTA
jgi:signal transduction histidine kinase